jgi:hypothetical protein
MNSDILIDVSKKLKPGKVTSKQKQEVFVLSFQEIQLVNMVQTVNTAERVKAPRRG